MEYPVRTISTLARVADLPGYVKSAQATYPDNLPRQAYADREGKRLPVHTKEATYISYIDFFMNNGKDRQIEKQLRKSARYFGITADVDKTLTQLKEKKAEVKYAVEIDGDKLFPISTPDEVRKSAEVFVADSTVSKLPFDTRRDAAKNILKAAAELDAWQGIPKLEYIRKAAGIGVKPREEILTWVEKRAKAVKSELNIPGEIPTLVNNYYSTLYKAAKGTPEESFTEQYIEKLAEAIDAADRLTGNYRQYENGWITPEEICYTGEVPEDPVQVKMSAALEGLRNSGLTIEDFSPLGQDFVSRIKSANAWRTDQSGIDHEALLSAAQELQGDDRVLLRRILRTAQ